MLSGWFQHVNREGFGVNMAERYLAAMAFQRFRKFVFLSIEKMRG